MPALTCALVTGADAGGPGDRGRTGRGERPVGGTAVPPLSLVTVLTKVRCAAWSLLLMVQVADTPSGSTRLVPVRVPRGARPRRRRRTRSGVVSDSVYVPALTGALVTGGDPVAPVIVVGPVAVSVQSVGAAVPPLSLVTVLTKVSVAAWSSLLIVHVADTPSGSTRLVPVRVPRGARPRLRGVPGQAGLGQRVRAGAHRRVGHRCRPGGPGDRGRPVAVSVQSVGTAVPPLSLVTVLTSVRCAAWSLLLIVHVADTPSGSTRLVPVRVPAVHDHAPGGVPGRAGLGQGVRAGADRGVGHRGRPGGPGDRGRPGRGQRPVGRHRGAAVVVGDRLDQGQRARPGRRC